jgi:hypothetical protein
MNPVQKTRELKIERDDLLEEVEDGDPKDPRRTIMWNKIRQINQKLAATIYSDDLKALIALLREDCKDEIKLKSAYGAVNFSHASLMKHFSKAKQVNHSELTLEQLQRKYDAVQIIL